jgi:hypothetical protein
MRFRGNGSTDAGIADDCRGRARSECDAEADMLDSFTPLSDRSEPPTNTVALESGLDFIFDSTRSRAVE